MSDATVTTVMYVKTCWLRDCEYSAAVVSVKRTADAVTVT